MYLDKPLKDFLLDTFSKTPTPGGGSVAALTGALGASLLGMAANYTVGKKKFKSVEGRIKEILKELEEKREKFSQLIREDIDAYQNFSKVLDMPKNTSEEKEARAQALQSSLKEATQVPLTTASVSFRLIEIAYELSSKSNPNLISDVGVGVILAWAALESAALNVKINLSRIKDSSFVEEKINFLLSEGEKIKEDVVEKVKGKISSK
ncbi:cyclodeaminase/cyclohydrolase family protein [Patescibacteria group bacterium]|nr:cyclodeaminase/cyclohydrolase family protein [Patescibacteria group bacterium]